MAEHKVVITDTGEEFICRSDRKLVDEHNRVALRSIRNQCRSGGCGLCRVQIVSGEYEALPMSRDHISDADKLDGVVLACRVRPQGDLLLRLCGQAPRFSWRF